MTWPEFASMFGVLALQLQKSDADEAIGRAYFLALRGLEPELVAMAAQRMGQQGGGSHRANPHWFPKASEWKALALKIEGERAEAVAKRVREYHRLANGPLCLDCDDSGWIQARKFRDGPSSTQLRWKHCGCRSLRRLEMLGRRPMPLLPASPAGWRE